MGGGSQSCGAPNGVALDGVCFLPGNTGRHGRAGEADHHRLGYSTVAHLPVLLAGQPDRTFLDVIPCLMTSPHQDTVSGEGSVLI